MILADIVCPGILCILCLPADEASCLYAVRKGMDACVAICILTHQCYVPGNKFSHIVQFPDIVAYEVEIDLGQGLRQLEPGQVVADGIGRYAGPQIIVFDSVWSSEF